MTEKFKVGDEVYDLINNQKATVVKAETHRGITRYSVRLWGSAEFRHNLEAEDLVLFSKVHELLYG